MDGVAGGAHGILIMGATNRLAALDPALVRPGRFDRVLQLSLPEEAGRLQILRGAAATHSHRAPLSRLASRGPLSFARALLCPLVRTAPNRGPPHMPRILTGVCIPVCTASASLCARRQCTRRAPRQRPQKSCCRGWRARLEDSRGRSSPTLS
eukprot:3533629-Prymnesium_polylepis.1